ncbi:Peroxisome assembly protein 12 [Vanrija pseudolonga]|uniref:Peroxisome assembly protein 12 n=1 Tax=Vanrija pseudolonga TaxID=143232 RepID=A0AAF0YC98_9TREE|nr:Peroxisome assembly protein 12 [Vanrija pseudolonga]
MTSRPVFPEAGPSNSYLRPHLVELIPQEQLRLVLHPVFRYVLTYLAQHYPRYFLRVVNRHEEAFALVLLLIERHHLWKHDASLSEHFYGLRLTPTHIPTPRLASIQAATRPRLSNRQRWGMLLVLVGLPYVRARADDAYDRWSTQNDPELALADQGPPLTTIQQAFIKVYPWIVTGFETTLLAYDVAYLFNKTDYFRPWHKLLRVKIERAVQDEEPASQTWLSKLPPLLPPLLLALKFAQWWYSPNSPRSLPTTATTSSLHTHVRPPRPLPIAPESGLLTPPSTPPPGAETSLDNHPQQQAYTIDVNGFGLCPICKGKWANPAILPSGWVVCYRCGWDAISGEGEQGEAGKGRCPITGVEVHPSELRRVLV